MHPEREGRGNDDRHGDGNVLCFSVYRPDGAVGRCRGLPAIASAAPRDGPGSWRMAVAETTRAGDPGGHEGSRGPSASTPSAPSTARSVHVRRAL